MVLDSLVLSDKFLQAPLHLRQTVSKRPLSSLVDDLPVEDDVKPLGEGGVSDACLVVHKVGYNFVTIIDHLTT